MKNEQNNINDSLLLKVLEGETTAEERKQWTEWLASSPDHPALFEELKKVHEISVGDPEALERNWAAVLNKIKTAHIVPDYIELPEATVRQISAGNNSWWKVAAAVIVLVGIGLVWSLWQQPVQTIRVAGTDLPPNAGYTLADGSVVYLNGDASISFTEDFGEENREISLTGEAFFEVKRNEALPFKITTFQTTTEVLGTSFNVFSDASQNVKVSVVSGVVAFSSNETKELVKLTVGDQGNFDPTDQSIEKTKTSNQNFLAWKTGVLTFDETPIKEAFQLLSKQYARILIFEGNTGEQPLLTTTINNQNLEDVLEELNILLNARHETRNDTLVFKPNL